MSELYIHSTKCPLDVVVHNPRPRISFVFSCWYFQNDICIVTSSWDQPSAMSEINREIHKEVTLCRHKCHMKPPGIGT
jgi:hypothetical protein